MYCRYCGEKIADNVEKCPHCGALAEDSACEKSAPAGKSEGEKRVNRKEFNAFSLLGIIFALVGVVNGIVSMIVNANAALAISFFVFIIAGLVLSITGTVKSKKYRSGKVTGILGIVISGLALFLYVGFFLLIVIIFTSLGQAF